MTNFSHSLTLKCVFERRLHDRLMLKTQKGANGACSPLCMLCIFALYSTLTTF